MRHSPGRGAAHSDTDPSLRRARPKPGDLRELIEAIAGSPDSSSGLATLVESFGRSLGAHAAALAVRSAEGKGLVARAVWSSDSAELEVPLVMAYENALTRALGSDDVVVEPIRFRPFWRSARGNGGGEPAEGGQSPSEGHSAVVAPVRAGPRDLGGLFADVPEPPDGLGWTIETARDYAAVAGMCLRDALEIDHLRELMARDQLTGCLNRTGTFRAVSDEIARSRRHGHLLCVCFLDIDDFKRINDRYGHLVGDRVLREIGRALQATVRGYDLIGRIGGDEFLAVMPETDEAGATAAARRLVERIEAIHSIGEGADVEVSAKFGIARWRPGQDTDDLIRDADRVLLQRKAGARRD